MFKMVKLGWCLGLTGRKKDKKLRIDQVGKESLRSVDFNKAFKSLTFRPGVPVGTVEGDELKTGPFTESVPVAVQNNFSSAKSISHGSVVGDAAAEVAYEGEDEHEDNASMKRDLSDFDLQYHVANLGECEFTPRSKSLGYSDSFETGATEHFTKKSEKDGGKGVTDIGHLSDPGIGKAEFWGSPKLKRSCSNLETSKVLKQMAGQFPLPTTLYSGESQEISEKWRGPGSPASVRSHCSADRVMLRKHSSSQVLPSRSRKLWWKLFLWNHRNAHKWTAKLPLESVNNALNQQSGYHSDTVEPNRAVELSITQSPGSMTAKPLDKSYNNDGVINQSWDDFHGGFSGSWLHNQWVAFPVESSSFSRVEEWVKDVESQPPPSDRYDGDNIEGIVFPPSPENGRSPPRSTAPLNRHTDACILEDILLANTVIQSLNSSSTVAHILGASLKAIPSMSHFSSLRSVNLSNNSIVCISPGSLPRGLHVLNLSRNKINAIEGLRELTRLRVLDLSYNRISRIGQGLSNCSVIKELYLAGNKISDVEGLHRLLKLTVLDLSFNKITTAKALGQLVANYNSLQALNLLGNPIQSNISDEQLQKAVCGLLPKLAYLNKQPIKPQRAREIVTDSVAKAAMGTNSKYSSRRRASKRVSSGGSASSVHRSNVGAVHKRRNGSKSCTNRLKTVSSAHASSSR
uniref:Uncharacterized protein n=1 Tax=Rhizophora mucronata TaxID=61149 RepID=A0A2P2IZB7_RHIMU